MQPMTADERPNILSDIKRDHAGFFSLHRRFMNEPNLSDEEKQTIIWQVCKQRALSFCCVVVMGGSVCTEHQLSCMQM
jgi:hypothetical protein